MFRTNYPLLKESFKALFKKRTTQPLKTKTFKESRGKHIHDPAKCNYCSICARNCPAFCIQVIKDKEIWAVDLSKCIFCGRCEGSCPTNAITFSNNFNMAYKNKTDMREECRK